MSYLCPGCKLPRDQREHLAGCEYANADEPEITGPHQCPARDGRQCELREDHQPQRHAWSTGEMVHLWE